VRPEIDRLPSATTGADRPHRDAGAWPVRGENGSPPGVGRGERAAPATLARVTRDFVGAVREGRAPRTTGASVLAAMRVLAEVQDDWDRRFGAQRLPGRPL